MSKRIIVDPQKLTSAAAQMGRFNDTYRKNYGELYQKVSLLSNIWKGTDNADFTNQIEGFHEDFNMMAQLMDDYIMYLNSTAATYEKTQREISEAVKKLLN